jgi:hypothetical protein
LFIGISLSNAFGIIQGYFGIKSPFIRTPKFNWNSVEKRSAANKYTHSSINGVTVAEGLLAFYFLFGLVTALRLKNFGLVPMFIMAMVGFSMVFILTLQERSKKLDKPDE